MFAQFDNLRGFAYVPLRCPGLPSIAAETLLLLMTSLSRSVAFGGTRKRGTATVPHDPSVF